MQRSQREMRMGEPIPLSPSSIEVEESIFKKLTSLASKEQIPINQLVSEMLKMFITLHHRELRQLIETLKKRSPRLKVGVSFQIDPDFLDSINRDIPAKTQSERIRKCVEQGYKVLKR